MAERETQTENPTTGAEGAGDDEAIRQRAYEISQRDDAGSAQENWQRAEAELEAERGSGTGQSR